MPNVYVLIFSKPYLLGIYLKHITHIEPWTDEATSTEKAESLAEEAKSLKQISFPEMDSDGLPSSFAMKVVACLGKWQIKMYDLAGSMDPSNQTMKTLPGLTPLLSQFQQVTWNTFFGDQQAAFRSLAEMGVWPVYIYIYI